jgi:AraC-like DNA-binding protein
MQILIQLYVLTSFMLIILSRSAKNPFSDKLLKTVLALMIYAGGSRVALGLDPDLPFFFHASVILTYALLTPGIYLYLRNTIQGRRLKEQDLVHVIPFLALCIYGVVAFSLGINVHIELRKVWSFSSGSSYDLEVLMPLFLFIYCFTAFYFFLVLLLLKKTVILDMGGVAKSKAIDKESNQDHPAEKVDAPHHSLVISEARMMEISGIVKEVLDEKKPYLRARYSLRDLTADTNIPLHQLSAFINKYCGKNFNDFINEFRVIYCKEKILNEEYKYKKLEAIAEESGFNNRNTFAVAFKKATGVNPSEFLRNVKSDFVSGNGKTYTVDPSATSKRAII